MFKKKLIALGLTAVMIASLAACGDSKDENKSNADTTPAASTDSNQGGEGGSGDNKASADGIQSAAEDHSAVSADCIVSFEDGNYSFAQLNETDWTRDKDSVMSVVDAFGSKALQVTRPNGGAPCVAFDVAGLLGANAANVAKITLDIGMIKDSGFDASSGQVILAAKKDVDGVATDVEIATDFSIYKATSACKTITIDLDGAKLDNSSYITFGTIDDTGVEKNNITIDNIIFYDASGNALPVDTTVTFAVEGVGQYDWSNMVKQPIDEVLLFTGTTTDSSNEWWPVASNSWCFRAGAEEGVGANPDVMYFDPAKYTFGPGDIITVYYQLNAEMETWQKQPRMIVQWYPQTDEEGNVITDPGLICMEEDQVILGMLPTGLDDDDDGEHNRDDDGTAAADAYVNESNTIAQFTYEQFVQFAKDYGMIAEDDNTTDFLKYVPFAGIAANGANLKIKAVTVGKNANN